MCKKSCKHAKPNITKMAEDTMEKQINTYLELCGANWTCGSKFRPIIYCCNIQFTSSNFASNNSKLKTIYKAILKIPLRRQTANTEMPVIQKPTQDMEVNQGIWNCDFSYQHVLYLHHECTGNNFVLKVLWLTYMT